MAGLWTAWRNPETGHPVYTYTLLTRPANPLLSKIHNEKQRMPCLLTVEQENTLRRERLSPNELLELLSMPFPDAALQAYPISRGFVKSVKPMDISILVPHPYPELTALTDEDPVTVHKPL